MKNLSIFKNASLDDKNQLAITGGNRFNSDDVLLTAKNELIVDDLVITP